MLAKRLRSLENILSRLPYAQILCVFLAFLLMGGASYIYSANTEQRHLKARSAEMFDNAETLFVSGMREMESMLDDIAETISEMLLWGDGLDEVREYIVDITVYGREVANRTGFIGIFAYFDIFNGEGVFGTAPDFRWQDEPGFTPEERPWYKAANTANGRIGTTNPYKNAVTGIEGFSLARAIFDENKNRTAIICLEVSLSTLYEHSSVNHIYNTSTWMLLDQNLTIVAFPHPEFIGMPLRDAHDAGIAEAAEILERGENVTGQQFVNAKGEHRIHSIKRLENGWYMGVALTADDYYTNIWNLQWFLYVVGIGMSLLLSTILISIHLGKLKAEEQVTKEYEKTAQLAHWYHTILDAIPLPVTVTDSEMRWTYVNTAVEEFLGTKREEMLGELCSNWDAHICNTDQCGIACVKRGIKHTYFTQNDLSFKVDVEILRDLNGETAGFIEIVQDITEIEVMAKRQADIEAASNAKTAFLANMSHEIRTPMNAILGIAEIQLRSETLSSDTEEAFSKIYESGDLLLKIVNDVLDLSKIEAGKLELAEVNYDVPSLINDTAQLCSLRHESTPIEFSLRVDENTPLELIGDVLRIKQILNNILSNAFKYTTEGKVILSVSAQEANVQNDTVTMVFCVSDTGQGMTEDDVDKLFDEYTRFNTGISYAVSGTGLGMSITKRLVDLMGGDITVDSEVNRGTVVTVSLPQKSVGPEVCGKELAIRLRDFKFKKAIKTRKSQFTHELMPYGKVLVVDDLDSNLFVARGMLVPYGLNIDTAKSGYEAVEKIEQGKIYDLVFMDHMMPGMDGIETVEIIRKNGYSYPIIALTANAMIGREEMFLANGFDGFISKPIDSRELDKYLKKFVRIKNDPETVDDHSNQVNEIPGGVKSDPGEMEEFFLMDAKSALETLEQLSDKLPDLGDKDLELYITTVHGVKSALSNIGEDRLSGDAYVLENAAGNRDYDLLARETPVFMDALRSLITGMQV